jgi:DNA-binding protein YbaB
MADLLNAVSAETAATRERIQAANEDKPTYAGSADHHKVSVVLNATAVLSGITIDDKWLGSASTERVVSGLREAFDSAYGAFDQATSSDPATATPIADRATALVSDTTRLVRWLRQED